MEDELAAILAGLNKEQLRATLDFNLNFPYSDLGFGLYSASRSPTSTTALEPALTLQPLPTSRNHFNVMKKKDLGRTLR